jgi:hypothetical protein
VRTTQDLFNSFSDTVLLVGNGAIYNQGELIDSYETVVRFNLFAIDGYEEHVGTKTSAIGFHSANLTMNHTTNLVPVYEKYINTIPIFAFSRSREKYARGIHILQEDTRMFAAGVLISNSPKLSISTGISTALNLSLFFNKEVHLIGFDFMKTGHYWEEAHIHSTQHDGNFEEQLINKINTIKVL